VVAELVAEHAPLDLDALAAVSVAVRAPWSACSMGSTFFFTEEVPNGFEGIEDRRGRCQLEMAECNRLPDLRVGPVRAAETGYVIRFSDWKQFERFADAVEDVRRRLKALHE
jgi:hypothetical protein